MKESHSHGGGLLRRADAAWDRWQAWRTRRALGRKDLCPLPYHGYGRRGRVRILGRVLRSVPQPWREDWGALRNGAALLRRLLAPAAPAVQVRVWLGEAEATAVTNEAGRFDLEMSDGGARLRQGFYRAVVSVPGRHAEATADAQAAAPASDSAFGVLSDVDDTILESGVRDTARWWLRTLAGGPFGRRPVEGMAGFYRALRGGPSGEACNPFFYVSGSSWDLHDLLTAFLDRHRFPAGHLRLKDVRRGFGPEPRGRQREYKEPHMRAILEFFPDLPFVLVGDAGEVDAAICAGLARDHPGRVKAVYIRLLPGPDSGRERIRSMQEECASLGVEMVAFEEARQAAADARERGLTR